MFIEQVDIKDHAILSDVTARFGKTNVVYGRNGTGKTLLSEIFRAAEIPQPIQFGTAKFEIRGIGTVASDQFRGGTLKDHIRVFNRKFVEENVFDTDPAAIVIGSESQEARERVAKLDKHIDDLREELDTNRKDRKSEQLRLDTLKTDRGREIRAVLLPATGVQGAHHRWPNFDRTDVDRIAREIGQEITCHLRDKEELDAIIQSIAQHSYPPVSEVNVPQPAIEQWIQRAKRLCSISLVVSPLTEVLDNEQLSTWLDAGLKLMADSRVCPLCKQTFPDDRLGELLDHFTDQRGELTKQLEELSSELTSWLEATKDPKLADTDVVRANLRQAYSERTQEIHGALEEHRLVVIELQGLLARKQRSASEVIEVNVSPHPWPKESQVRANELIRRHNDASEVLSLCREFERAVVAGSIPEMTAMINEINRLDEVEVANDARLEKLVAEREDALARSRGQARAAAELSRRLTDFVGHAELSFSSNEDGSSFRVMRQGNRAEGLSEGERNAVGLVYFLMQLDDSRKTPADVAVVLDDPVTSFDDLRVYDAVSEILFRTGTKGDDKASVGQLFVLTHHLGLLDRLWRELPKKSNVKFLELRNRYQGVSDSRRSELVECENPTRFRYHMAFEEVYLLANRYEKRLGGANSIRICLEGFLFARVPGSFASGARLENMMRKVNDGIGDKRLDPSSVHFICSVANAGSHDDSPDKPTNIEDEQDRYRKVAERLLQFMESVDPMHFKDMEQDCKKRLARENPRL